MVPTVDHFVAAAGQRPIAAEQGSSKGISARALLDIIGFCFVLLQPTRLRTTSPAEGPMLSANAELLQARERALPAARTTRQPLRTVELIPALLRFSWHAPQIQGQREIGMHTANLDCEGSGGCDPSSTVSIPLPGVHDRGVGRESNGAAEHRPKAHCLGNCQRRRAGPSHTDGRLACNLAALRIVV
jgi:hypothetical protein